MEGDEAVYSAPPEVFTKIISAGLESENEIRLELSRIVDLDFLGKQDFYLVEGENSRLALKARFYGAAKYGKTVLLELPGHKTTGPENPDWQAVNAGLWRLHARDLNRRRLSWVQWFTARIYFNKTNGGFYCRRDDGDTRLFPQSNGSFGAYL